MRKNPPSRDLLDLLAQHATCGLDPTEESVLRRRLSKRRDGLRIDHFESAAAAIALAASTGRELPLPASVEARLRAELTRTFGAAGPGVPSGR